MEGIVFLCFVCNIVLVIYTVLKFPCFLNVQFLPKQQFLIFGH